MLENEYIILRPIQHEDTPNILKWRNTEEVRKRFIWQEELTEKSHTKWLVEQVGTGKVSQFIIVDKIYQEAIGTVYLRDISMQHSKAEFGIFIGESQFLGKGYGYQATSLILSYGFKTLKLNKIFLRVLGNNLSAIHAYEKAGFVEEGVFKQDVRINDHYEDVIFMGMLNPYINVV